MTIKNTESCHGLGQRKHVNAYFARFRRSTGAAQIAEFGAAFYLLVTCITVLLGGLMALAFSIMVGTIATTNGVESAANTNSYDTALSKASEAVLSLSQAGFGHLASLHPIGGYKNSGTHLYIGKTDKKSHKIVCLGPDIPLSAAPQPDKYNYSYKVVTQFAAGPLFGNQSSPMIGIPYVSQPVSLTFSAQATVEHVDSLNICIAGAPDLK